VAYGLPKQPAHLAKGVRDRISGEGKTDDDAPLDGAPVRVQYGLPPDRAHTADAVSDNGHAVKQQVMDHLGLGQLCFGVQF